MSASRTSVIAFFPKPLMEESLASVHLVSCSMERISVDESVQGAGRESHDFDRGVGLLFEFALDFELLLFDDLLDVADEFAFDLEPLFVEEAEVGGEHVAREADDVLRPHDAVGENGEFEGIEVGHLSEAEVLDFVLHVAYRGEVRVDQEDVDVFFAFLEFFYREVSDVLFDADGHVEDESVAVDFGDVEIRVENLDRGRSLDVGRGNLTGLVLHEVNPFRAGIRLGNDEVLEVQEDVEDGILDARDSLVFVADALDLDSRYAASGDAREHNAAEAVAYSDAVSARKRSDDEARLVFGNLFLNDFRNADRVMDNVHSSGRRLGFLWPTTSSRIR